MPRLPVTAVLTHQISLVSRRRPWQRQRATTCFSFDVQSLAGRDDIALAACRSVGAPATAVAIEEMAVAGVRRLILLDVAGSLTPGLRSGDALLAESAIVGDGTSPHYWEDDLVSASESLTTRLGDLLTEQTMAYSRGRMWSTDAVYRETVAGIQEARDKGAMAVDMETACVLAVATTLGIEAAAVLAIADELSDGWRPPIDMSSIHDLLSRILSVIAVAHLP